MPAHHLIDPQHLIAVGHEMLALQAKAESGAIVLDGLPALSDWSIVKARWRGLAGLVAGHPKLGSGRIYTTPIVSIDTELGWVRTVNTLYKLEEPGDDVARLLITSKR